ncbi:MAG: CdaR family protein [Pseudomonadota bacterium]
MKKILFYNWQHKLIAVLTAVVIWSVISSSQKTKQIINAEVKINIPSSYVITNQNISEISVSVSGQKNLVRSLQRKNLLAIVDIKIPIVGLSSQRIHVNNIDLPKGLEILSITPSTVLLNIDSVREKFIKLIPQLDENLPAGYSIADIKVSPAQIPVKGAASELNKISNLNLSGISLEERTKSFSTEDVNINFPSKNIWTKSDNKIKVSISIKENFSNVSFSNVPISLNTSLKLKGDIFPTSFESVVLYGSEAILKKLNPEDIIVVKDIASITKGQTLKIKINKEDFKLPTNMKLIEFSPLNFVVKLYETETESTQTGR